MSELTDWPDGFDPDRAPVFAHNEIVSAHAAGDLWPILVRASAWPDWYPHAADVRGVGADGDLALGTAFRWTTLGVRVATIVTECTPNRALAWSGTARGSRGHHRWLFEPAPGGGCRILTEEVQTGVIPTLLAARLRRSLLAFHQEWLEGLVGQVRPQQQS